MLELAIYTMFGSMIIGLILLVLSIINFIAKKEVWKKNLKWLIITLTISAVSIGVGVIVMPSDYSGEMEEVNKIKTYDLSLTKESFDFKLNSAIYNRNDNSFTIDIQSGLPDESVIFVSLRTSAATEKAERLAEDLFIDSVQAKVENNKIIHTFTNEDFNNAKFMDDTYYVTIEVPVDYLQNSFISEQFSSPEEFSVNFPTLKDSIITNTDVADYIIVKNLEDIKDVKGAYTLEEILKEYTKEKISYKELEKNPEHYTGELVSYTGTVLQIQEEDKINKEGIPIGGSQSTIRLNVSEDPNEVIYVSYESLMGLEAVREDKITVYGEITGSTTYESVAGYKITIPSVDAMVIENN